MATGYTNFDRVSNTITSGSALEAGLTNLDIRALEFDAVLRSVSLTVPDAGVDLSVGHMEQLIQAAIASLPVDFSAVTGTSDISLGADTASQASVYTKLFDLKTTSDVRVLRMFASNIPNTDGSPTDNIVVRLVNDDGTDVHVIVQLDGVASGSGAVQIFDTHNAPGDGECGLFGSERIILVSATDLTAGSEVVVFNVLSDSL